MQFHEHGFTAIPNIFLDRLSDMSGSSIKVLCYLLRGSNQGMNYGWFTVTTKQIAQDTGLSPNSVREALRWLEEENFIEVGGLKVRVAITNVKNCAPAQKLSQKAQKLSQKAQKLRMHVYKQPESTYKQPPCKNEPELTPEFNELVVVLEGIGLDSETAKRSLSIAEKRGFKPQDIHNAVGYVAQMPNVQNPAGLLIYLLIHGNRRQLAPRASEKLLAPQNKIDWGKYGAGGKYAFLQASGKESND